MLINQFLACVSIINLRHYYKDADYKGCFCLHVQFTEVFSDYPALDEALKLKLKWRLIMVFLSVGLTHFFRFNATGSFHFFLPVPRKYDNVGSSQLSSWFKLLNQCHDRWHYVGKKLHVIWSRSAISGNLWYLKVAKCWMLPAFSAVTVFTNCCISLIKFMY